MYFKAILFALFFNFSYHLCFDQGLNDFDSSSYVYEAHVVGLFTTGRLLRWKNANKRNLCGFLETFKTQICVHLDAEIPIENPLIDSTLNMALESAAKRYPRIKFNLSVKLGNGTCLRNNGGAVAGKQDCWLKIVLP